MPRHFRDVLRAIVRDWIAPAAMDVTIAHEGEREGDDRHGIE
jgi:hypothetical protein